VLAHRREKHRWRRVAAGVDVAELGWRHGRVWADHTVTGYWNATLTVSGQTVTVRGNASTGTVAPGGRAEWGFQGSHPDGSTALPSAYTCTTS
jgi:hypothetical protein